MSLVLAPEREAENVAPAGVAVPEEFVDERLMVLAELSDARAHVQEAEAVLRAYQLAESAILQTVWSDLVPEPRKYLSLRRKVDREAEKALEGVDPSNRYEARQAVEAKYSSECSVAWTNHSRRHKRAGQAVRRMREELSPIEEEYLDQLNFARSQERAARAKLEQLLLPKGI